MVRCEAVRNSNSAFPRRTDIGKSYLGPLVFVLWEERETMRATPRSTWVRRQLNRVAQSLLEAISVPALVVFLL